MKSIAYFNNKGGVGKTSLVYHTAWMFAELGYRTLMVDLDPQSNLSIMALDEERLEALYAPLHTLFGAVAPLFGGTGDIRSAHIEPLSDALGLIVGDLALSTIEDDLSTEWPRCLEGRERAFRVTTAFWRVIKEAAARHQADVVLIDVGPNLGGDQPGRFGSSRICRYPSSAGPILAARAKKSWAYAQALARYLAAG
jgi:cellulose biosynthesis protein BcsQ